VSVLGEQSDDLNTFRVSRPYVHTLLGNVADMIVRLNIIWREDVASSFVVSAHAISMELSGGL